MAAAVTFTAGMMDAAFNSALGVARQVPSKAADLHVHRDLTMRLPIAGTMCGRGACELYYCHCGINKRRDVNRDRIRGNVQIWEHAKPEYFNSQLPPRSAHAHGGNHRRVGFERDKTSIGGSPYADATAVEHMEKSTDHIKKIDRPYVLTKVFINNTLSNDNNNMYVHMDTRMKYPYMLSG